VISAEPRKTACFVVLRWRRLKPRLLKGKGPAEASGTKGKGEKKRTGDRGMFKIMRGVFVRWHRQECLCYWGNQKSTSC